MAAGEGEGGMGTTSCPDCHKRYPWRDGLEGRKLKCKCGNVFEAALDLEGAMPDRDDRTYDVAGDYVAPMAPRAVSAGPTGSTAAPIMPAGSVSLAPGSAQRGGGKVLTYAHATPAEAAELRERSMFREWYLPIMILGVGGACWAGQVVVESRAGTGAGTGGLIGAALFGIALNVVLTLAAVAVSGKLMSIDFGSIPELILKVTATAVLGGALGALTISIFPKDDLNGPIIALHVVMILYWILFYTFFEMDLQECLMTVAIVTAFHIAGFCIVFKPI